MADWKTVKLETVGCFQNGEAFSSAYFNFENKGLRLVRNRDLKNDDQVVYYDGLHSDHDVVSDGDLLVGMDGDFTPVIWKKGKALLNQRVGRVLIKDGASQEYIYYALFSALAELEHVTSATTVKHLSSKTCLGLEIPLPPLAEQRKIAEILRTWDEAIETAETELKAKQERKRWIMDQLFKFAPESQMEILQMREALDIQKGEQLNRHTLSDEGRYPVWNGGVTPSGYTELHNTEGPAVIMSEGGNSCGTVTYVRGNFWRGGHCYQVVPNAGFTNDYLFAALKYYEAQIMRLRVGSGLPNIQKKTFLSWSAPLHVLAFREKVAAIFSQAQLESELVIGRIESLRTQKRGLMQKLLTGEVRVAA